MTVPLSIAIPTYNRGEILLETIERLLRLDQTAGAIIVADQTAEHPPPQAGALERWSRSGTIVWLRLAEPSIPRAMNSALLAARTPLVLFLDDDVLPAADLVAAHTAAHADPAVWAVAGQVLEPGEEPVVYVENPPREERGARGKGLEDLAFRFNSTRSAVVANVMAGNLSVKRDRAIAIRGFDENFVGAAYRFETDFARRLVGAGGLIRFDPGASVRHLKLASGGLRSYGDHRASASPAHSVGDYYFAMHHVPGFLRYAGRRIRQNVATSFHVSHPWTIPSKVLGELRGVLLARALFRKGRRLLAVPEDGIERNQP